MLPNAKRDGVRQQELSPAGTTRYLLDGLSVIAQYAPDGARQAWYTQSLARIDEVLNVANESGKFWYQADALGSVYGLTNQAGALIGSQSYDVFGAPTPAPSGPAGQPFGFTGREHELDSGLVYARDRYVNPATGLWTQVDRFASPVHASDATTRLAAQLPTAAWRFTASVGATLANTAPRAPYAYANASPTVWTDPTGFVPRCTPEFWIGAPLVFAEAALGPAAGILFAGIYSSIDTGRQVVVVSLLAEVGLFKPVNKSLIVQPSEKGASFEVGVGFGREVDVARDEFESEIFAERVYQIGPVVLVYGTHGESVFVTNHFGIGGGVLFGGGWVNWVWDL